ncbi:LamG-like jellyroll fold domain-containing protein [Streptomyces sp. NPDC094034]|uniref:LamG-like jellyroll fold domain-containing protein n=1 Tax=Streptomyces sp. NPDC094034 TaxID=3155309 RepID=UPI00333056A9
MTETGTGEFAVRSTGIDGAGTLRAWWKFDEGAGTTATDSSGNGHTLTATGDPGRSVGGTVPGAVAFDGVSQWLSTEGPVLRTDQSFSVAAWVRLDATTTAGDIDLPAGQYAIAAVAQDGPSHSPFYLGARKVLDGQTTGAPEAPLRWDFTVAPIDGAVTGTIEWPHAAAGPVQPALGEWVLLVGIYDLDAGTATLVVPGAGDVVTVPLPEGWPQWHAEGGVQLGRARYLDKVSDLWPGSVGPVRIFSGVLTAEDAAELYRNDTVPES